MWPIETQYPTSSGKVSSYDTSTCGYYDTHTFGKPKYSCTLKREILLDAGHTVEPPYISSRPCSLQQKVISSLNDSDSNSDVALSSLQKTLLGCGRISIADTVSQKKTEQLVAEAFTKQRDHMKNHAKWLGGISESKSAPILRCRHGNYCLFYPVLHY